MLLTGQWLGQHPLGSFGFQTGCWPSTLNRRTQGQTCVEEMANGIDGLKKTFCQRSGCLGIKRIAGNVFF